MEQTGETWEWIKGRDEGSISGKERKRRDVYVEAFRLSGRSGYVRLV